MQSTPTPQGWTTRQRNLASTPKQQAALLRLAEATESHPALLGRYDVVGILGQGGMGTVYTAIDRNNGVRVALKTIRGFVGQEPQRLKREFRIVADLVHDNLVPVYELGHEDDLWFFTMELVDGISFEKWVREGSMTSTPQSMTSDSYTLTTQEAFRERRLESETAAFIELPEEVILKLEPPPSSALSRRPSAPKRAVAELQDAFRQVANGVEALHSIGLRHGDIKASNVLVRPSGHVVIVDFGVCEEFQAAEAAGAPIEGVHGTPAYMAPEQLRGLPSGPPADWYAVGTMFYRALTGVAPYGSRGALNLYERKGGPLPEAPEQLVPVPHHLSSLCLSLLNPVASERLTGPQLLARLAASDDKSPLPSMSVGEAIYVGREAQLDSLHSAYEKMRREDVVVAHIHGPSGIGKSALVHHFLSRLDADAVKIFSGRCYERESVPYKAFDRIVDDLALWLQTLEATTVSFLPEWTAELTCIFPVLLSVPAIARRAESRLGDFDPKELRRRALIAFAEWLTALSKISPLVLSIDDLQWADRDSADLLDSLRSAGPQARILVVVGFRQEEASANKALIHFFDRRKGSGLVVDIPVTVLNPRDAKSMTRAMLGEHPRAQGEDVVSRIARESSGLPFLIEELVRYSLAHRAKPESLSLREVIAARMTSLPANERLLLEMAAVADSPIPQLVLFEAASLDPSEMRALLSLRQASLIRWAGPDTNAPVSTYHDSIRQAVLENISADCLSKHHRQMARALLRHHRTALIGTGIFEVVRHLNAGLKAIEEPDERQQSAELNLLAGRRARAAGAFQLAHRCFESGINFLNDAGWRSQYELALDLHNGAVEAAYLSVDYEAMKLRAKDVKAHGRTVLDQMPTWEAEINLHIGRQAYAEAIDTGSEVLQSLGIRFESHPDPADVNDAFEEVIAALAKVGPEGILARPDMDDPLTEAVMGILVRLTACSYYARPLLLPVIAGHLIAASIEKGLSPATPYALTVVGVLLNSVGKYSEAHTWGQLALRLLVHHNGGPLEACTRHVVHCLVCVWTVPLESTVDDLRAVVEIGQRTGDYEYAAYAAYASVYGRLYASRPIGPLLEDAVALSKMMRGFGTVNAMHTHRPFVQVLRCLRGETATLGCLDGPDYEEEAEVAAALELGSRHGLLSLRLTMGLARFYARDMSAAAEQFEMARLYLDPTTSVWHVPIFHQFSALAAWQSWPSTPLAEQPAKRARIEDSLARLAELAEHAPVNFAHRVELVEGALLALDGDKKAALRKFEMAAERAANGGWTSDEALAHELAADLKPTPEGRQMLLRAALSAYEIWGASAKVTQVSKLLA